METNKLLAKPAGGFCRRTYGSTLQAGYHIVGGCKTPGGLVDEKAHEVRSERISPPCTPQRLLRFTYSERIVYATLRQTHTDSVVMHSQSGSSLIYNISSCLVMYEETPVLDTFLMDVCGEVVL